MATESTFDIDGFLSTIAMSYAITVPSATPEKTSVVIPSPKKAGKVKRTVKSTEASVRTAASIVAEPVVKPGTIDAVGFFDAVKKAGRRPNPVGVFLYTTEQEQRQDERNAIQAYIGWNKNLPHGTNLDGARTAANCELKTGSFQRKEYCRSSKPTFDGYVAGMPNEQKKQLSNLTGRVSKSIQDLVEHESIMNNESLPQGTRDHHSAMAKLEEERIQQLNDDIHNFGF
jgi:hypothetical protein